MHGAVGRWGKRDGGQEDLPSGHETLQLILCVAPFAGKKGMRRNLKNQRDLKDEFGTACVCNYFETFQCLGKLSHILVTRGEAECRGKFSF